MTPGWATIIVGTAAAVIAIVTIGQKRLADNRKEWWTRFQWAILATYSSDPNETLDGWVVIADLLQSRLATRTERKLALYVAQRSSLMNDGDQPSTGGER
jgi:hypothetical protein